MPFQLARCTLGVALGSDVGRGLLWLALRLELVLGVNEQSTAVRSIQLQIALHFASLHCAQYVAYRFKRARQVASGGFELNFYVQQSADAFIQTTHDGRQLFRNDIITESRMRRQRAVQTSVRV
eukprot:5716394-Pleurochrysis_carterae.AAC.1